MATRDQLESTYKCSICLNLLDKPKVLSCQHTFCEDCLSTLYKSQARRYSVSCPLCRESTDLPQGDVSELDTDLVVQSLTDDLRTAFHYCTSCSEKNSAVTFCMVCDKYMCESCQQKHDDWSNFFAHEKFTMEEVKAGKMAAKKREKCDHHVQDMKDHWCRNCKKYICARCSGDHSQHNIIKAEAFKKSCSDNIAALVVRVGAKKDQLDRDIAFIKEQQMNGQMALQGQIQKIEAVCKETIRRAKERKDILVNLCTNHEKLITTQLEDMVNESDMCITRIESAGMLVRNGTRGRLEGEALVVHDTLCQELEKLLDKCEVDYAEVRRIWRLAAALEFKPLGEKENVKLGSLHEKTGWTVGAEKSLKDTMNAIATTPDGMMAVGSHLGGIQIFSSDGHPQQTVLKDVKVRALGFLSHGQYIVRDTANNILLYTADCEAVDVKFETLSDEEGGSGDLTVHSNVQIYVSYRRAKKIQVFKIDGGKAVREIPCDGYEPGQIFAMKSSKLLIMQDSPNSVRLIDESGRKRNNIAKNIDTYIAFPCVSQDGILIAWVKYKEGLVSIDRYTNELKYVQTLITGHNIGDRGGQSCSYLQEFPSREIGFCTPEKLYIFFPYQSPIQEILPTEANMPEQQRRSRIRIGRPRSRKGL